MSKSLARVRAALDAAGLTAEIRETDGARSAADAAIAVGCEIDQIAKSIIFRGAASGHLVLFLTAGGRQVDPALAARLAGEDLVRADAAQIREETGFAIGGVAPVGHLRALTSFCDPRLTEFGSVWAAAGTPRHVFSIAPADLLRITGARLGDFAV
ncbi:MAG: YbaK/EbsC family protein [Paracoccus sp. (in: a-proteobacteria)]|nr:YbaK/EbsC family protein [Paracoccus sp. (in: a-proteobacteria)]